MHIGSASRRQGQVYLISLTTDGLVANDVPGLPVSLNRLAGVEETEDEWLSPFPTIDMLRAELHRLGLARYD
jgi:hypothetical protein